MPLNIGLRVSGITRYTPPPPSPPTLLAHTSAPGGTTSPVDTTGVDFIVISCGNRNSASSAPTDNKGNTYIAVPTAANTTGQQIYYTYNPTVGTGHTFSVSGDYICVQAWNNMNITSSVYEAGTDGTSLFVLGNSTPPFTVTYTLPSTTPGHAGDLIITDLHGYFSSPGGGGWLGASLDNSFTETDFLVNTSSFDTSAAIAYKIATAGDLSGVAPTWTFAAGGGAWCGVIVCFKRS